MIVRYTRQALADLDTALSYIAQERPGVASQMGQHIRASIESLGRFPQQGRPGRVSGTRELIITRSPFIVAYRVVSDGIDVLAITHGARRWPITFGGQ